MTRDEFFFQADKFLEHLFNIMEAKNIFLKEHWNIDHLCFRTSTNGQYEKYKQDFSAWSELLSESEVNERPISVYKLKQPIFFKDWTIDLIELPAPKKGKLTTEGFEHIEVVCDMSFDEIKQLYPNCDYDESGLSKYFNQEIEIQLDDSALKFHHLSLESVVTLEKNSKVFSAISNSLILKSLHVFNPLIVGTFPLGISTKNSDVDLLLSAENLDELEEIIVKLFAHHNQFDIKRKVILEEESVISKFMFEEIQFELFAQKTPTIHQSAYLHFLVEERMLKLGGDKFRKKIIDFRNQGLKTEPAFVRAIESDGEPYKMLLNLQLLPEQNLTNILFKK